MNSPRIDVYWGINLFTPRRIKFNQLTKDSRLLGDLVDIKLNISHRPEHGGINSMMLWRTFPPFIKQIVRKTHDYSISPRNKFLPTPTNQPPKENGKVNLCLSPQGEGSISPSQNTLGICTWKYTSPSP